MQNMIVDPWCVAVRYANEHAICSDWLRKYETPTFSFTKSWKSRYVVLMGRMVYVFKTVKPTQPAKENFLLTEDTFVFVTEEFKKGYVIELRKPKAKWHLRCSSTDQMKTWLDAMKKIVACIKVGYEGVLTADRLALVTLTEDYRIRTLPQENNNRPVTLCKGLSTVRRLSPQRQSLSEIPDWETLIPPQLPPPRTKPPPIPLPTVSE
ncbi:hypothetical protein BY458DRAFT_516154 [Sporodiniella umbellata]|nr:hypothetical protein BY458DRAFT_516154 [Sporodiniella umbellata]